MFAGESRKFGFTEFRQSAHQTLPDFQAALRERHAPNPEVGTAVAGDPFVDAASHDFRLKPEMKTLDAYGARCFVPWGLSSVVGEWNFHPFADEAKPVVFGEHMNFTDEYFHRRMYARVPNNSLTCVGMTRADFVPGTLEDWTPDALRFNGKDAYCVLGDKEIKRDMDYEDEKRPVIHYDGSKRKSLDMGTNNFLVEIVFETAEKTSGGILMEKAGDQAGYRLRIDAKGCLALDLVGAQGVFSCVSTRAVNDGAWHHAIAEVDRAAANGARIYLDGVLATSTTSGLWPEPNASLANTNDFFVGRGARGAYFNGTLDFLRVARGTLADAYTTIEELYAWEFKGPMLKDFAGVVSKMGARSAGAIDGTRGREGKE